MTKSPPCFYSMIFNDWKNYNKQLFSSKDSAKQLFIFVFPRSFKLKITVCNVSIFGWCLSFVFFFPRLDTMWFRSAFCFDMIVIFLRQVTLIETGVQGSYRLRAVCMHNKKKHCWDFQRFQNLKFCGIFCKLYGAFCFQLSGKTIQYLCPVFPEHCPWTL